MAELSYNNIIIFIYFFAKRHKLIRTMKSNTEYIYGWLKHYCTSKEAECHQARIIKACGNLYPDKRQIMTKHFTRNVLTVSFYSI